MGRCLTGPYTLVSVVAIDLLGRLTDAILYVRDLLRPGDKPFTAVGTMNIIS